MLPSRCAYRLDALAWTPREAGSEIEAAWVFAHFRPFIQSQTSFLTSTVTLPTPLPPFVFHHKARDRNPTDMADTEEAPVVNKNKRHRKEKREWKDFASDSSLTTSHIQHGIRMILTSKYGNTRMR